MSPKPSMPVCRFHPNCKRSSCKFRHPSQPIPENTANESHTHKRVETWIADSRIDPTSDVVDQVDEPIPVCIFYQGGTPCGQGDACKFAHIEPEERRSKLDKSPTQTTFTGSLQHATDASNNEHQSGLIDDPSSHRILPPRLTTIAPIAQISQPPKQLVVSESQHYPHISEVTLHWSQFADPLAVADLPFCRPFAQGKCSRADSCTFRHSLTIDEYFSLFRDPQPMLTTLRQEQSSIATVANLTPSRVVIPSAAVSPSVPPSLPSNFPNDPPATSKRKNPTECLFYPSGKCKNGSRCPYAHIRTQTSAPEFDEDDNWSPVASQKTKINKPCKFFNVNGFCRSGPDCLYKHIQGDVSSETSGPRLDLEGESTSVFNDNDWEQEQKKCDSASCDGASGQLEHEVDQSACEWTKPQDTSGWEKAAVNETSMSNFEDRPNRSHKSFLPKQSISKPCFQFRQGSCRRGDLCRYAHDNEPSDYQTQNRSTEFENKQPSMAPDIAKTQESELWEENNNNEEGPYHFVPPGIGNQKSHESLAPAQELVETLENPQDDCGICHELQLESNIPAHTRLEKFVMNTAVSFGPTLSPISIETLADCHRLQLSNLPTNASVTVLQALIQPYAGSVIENSLHNSERTASIQVEFTNPKETINAFKYLHLHEYSPGGKIIIASFLNVISSSKQRFQFETSTVKVSWPKQALFGWSHYPTITKAKDDADRLNGVTLNGRKVQVEFCKPNKKQRDNFAIRISNLSLETTKEEVRQLCDGATLMTGFGEPNYKSNPIGPIKELFQSFGDISFEAITESETDSTANSFAIVTFACEAIAQEVITELNSRKLSYIGERSLEINPVYFAQYRVSRKIFDVVRQEIDWIRDNGSSKYTIQYDENSLQCNTRLFASSSKEFVKANTRLCSLLQGKVARTEDGDVIWEDYFQLPTKGLQHFLNGHDNTIVPDERTKQVRLFGSTSQQQKALESLSKLLSKIRAQRHEVSLSRGSMRPFIHKFEAIQKEMGVHKVTFDVLGSKIIAYGSNEEFTKVKTLVDSLDSATEYTPGCCEICHRQPDEPMILVCRHVYCTPCLRVALQTSSCAPLRCIAATKSSSDGERSEQCLSHIPYVDGLLQPAETDRLLLSSFLGHVRESEDLFACPSINCKVIYRVGREGLNIQCAKCGTEICSFCQTLAHIGLSCSEAKKLILS